jgi:catechol 2,3-dioxygenase-like lactoylglutathione lyase family enzyme
MKVSFFNIKIVMRHLALACCAALIASCDAPAPSAAEKTPPVPDLKRPNLVVSDMERSLKIYRDILGLEASEVRPGSADSFSYPVFNVPKDANFRFVSLHEPGEERVLNLTEVTGMALPTPPSEPYMSALVIGIEDLEAKFKILASMGLKLTETDTAQGPDFRFIEQAFVDPDGHLIVCFEVIQPER